MVGYINSVRDKEYKLCTPEIFEQLVNSPMVQTNVEECRKGAQTKQLLPAFIFQGYDPNVLLGKTGSRLAKALKPTGFFIMDFDHVDELRGEKGEGSGMTPHTVYDKFLQKLPSLGFDLKRDVALAHITPSGKGLRLVLVTPKGMTIEAAQEWVAKGMEMEVDRVVKDLSRLSFCPMASDILYINKVLLFSVEPYAKAHEDSVGSPESTHSAIASCVVTDGNVAPQQAGAQGTQAGAQVVRQITDAQWITMQGTAETPHGSGAATSLSVTPHGGNGCKPAPECGDETDTSHNNRAASTTPSIFPECYNGIPYKRIVEELILLHGGEPQVGNRENTIFRLASDLAKITDRSAPWLESLIPTFGLPEEEWRQTISQVCKKPLETSMSRKLQEAIKRCEEIKAEEESVIESDNAEGAEGVNENLPPAMPKVLPPLIAHLVSNVPDHLKPAVSQMAYPALAAHVSNAKFLMMDNTEEELGLSAVLLAKQSGGKSCVKKPIAAIMADIDKVDDLNRERLRLWADERKAKKANEKGKPKPRVAIRWLDEDITSASFMERLGCAEKPEDGTPNQCCYTHCNELEKLYSFNTGNGKAMIRQTIKAAFDRDRVGSSRATAEAINEKTFLRWNWTAASTIENGKDFFSGKMITDGAVSRVDFCTIIPPKTPQEYVFKKYDKEWRDKLAPYIQNLVDFHCPQDEDGEIEAMLIPQARELERKLDAITKERNAALPNDVYEDYGRRCRTMTVKKMITDYIAHGSHWDEAWNDYALWMFNYSMWCKLAFFYDTAAEKFTSEKIVAKGHWSPLKLMPRRFTFAEFSAICQKNKDKIKISPAQCLYQYKNRGLVTQQGDTYIISDDFCTKYGIK